MQSENENERKKGMYGNKNPILRFFCESSENHYQKTPKTHILPDNLINLLLYIRFPKNSFFYCENNSCVVNLGLFLRKETI